MSGRTRYSLPLDVHLLAVRAGDAGPEVLLSRRAGAVYAAGMWHAPSGHVDGAHEDVVTAVVRETLEETGLVVHGDDVRAAVTVHHRGPGGRARVGFFFEVTRWAGTPRVREPHVCDAMGFFPLDALPDPMVAYCRAGLDAYRAGAGVALHFQEPGDPIAHDPALQRLRLVAGPESAAPGGRRARDAPDGTTPGSGPARDVRDAAVDTASGAGLAGPAPVVRGGRALGPPRAGALDPFPGARSCTGSFQRARAPFPSGHGRPCTGSSPPGGQPAPARCISTGGRTACGWGCCGWARGGSGEWEAHAGGTPAAPGTAGARGRAGRRARRGRRRRG
ncbi:NUDIX hydrolase [Streptomyces sp. t39]|uniref:NUDIX hydrolase n=1 Tax=Streptomyces sp. t39 TaxID=1828156 RepID=UPI0011CE857E|nr:NUDIX domain-containing protein [Streptomyces sp. t39]TXS57983.1 NUDIX domain-containing protein [Streptomyces sp. t39]